MFSKVASLGCGFCKLFWKAKSFFNSTKWIARSRRIYFQISSLFIKLLFCMSLKHGMLESCAFVTDCTNAYISIHIISMYYIRIYYNIQ